MESIASNEKNQNKTRILFNKEIIALFLFASACAAVNPYKNIFGIKVVGLPDLSYGIVMFVSGILLTFFSIYFGVKADKNGGFARYILICSMFGFVASIILFLYPNKIVYLISNCLLLPIFYCVNSLIFGYAAHKQVDDSSSSRINKNARLRAAYSSAYVLTLGVIGVLALTKDNLVFIWLYSAVFAILIILIYLTDQSISTKQEEKKFDEPFFKVFHKKNLIRLCGISLITNMLFTLDATAPLIIVDRVEAEYSKIGIFEALIALLEIGLIFWWSRMSNKHRPSILIIAGAITFSVGLLLMSISESMLHIYALIPVLALGAACLISMPIGYLQLLVADRPGLGSSLISVSLFLSSSFSAAFYSLGSLLFATQGAIWFSSIGGVIGLIIIYFTERNTTN
ncbi:MAG: hypothetical protein B0W54_12985 [Cellvibrio sp. 79]|nr:MAG: hypothetical protein B0W54_12985 [Cellvibrio sp. 79]